MRLVNLRNKRETVLSFDEKKESRRKEGQVRVVIKEEGKELEIEELSDQMKLRTNREDRIKKISPLESKEGKENITYEQRVF